MKEFDPSRLTNQAPQLTLKSERKFMPNEGTSEKPPVGSQSPDIGRQTPIRPEHIAAARAIFESPETKINWDNLDVGVKRAAIELARSRQVDLRGRGPGTMAAEVGEGRSGFDPSIAPIWAEAREFAGAGVIDPRSYQDLLRRLNETQPPETYNSTQRRTFEHQQQTIRSFLADQAVGSGPMKEQRKFDELSARLIEAVQSEDYDEVDNIMQFEVDIDNYSVYGGLVKNAVETVRGKDQVLEYLMEYAAERILSLSDDNPQEQYIQFNLYQQTSLDSIIQTARRYDERREGTNNPPKIFKRLSDLRTKRYAMHELFRSMRDRETYVKLVTQLLRKDGLAFVEKQVAGVKDVKQIYEQVLGSDLSLKEQGWLTGQDFKIADQEVEDHFSASLKSHPDLYQKEWRTPDGNTGNRPLRAWEIKRATRMGKALYAASLRRATYSVLGDLPKDPAIMYKSAESEYLSRILAPLKLIPEKFFDSAIARRFIDLAYHQLKRKSLKDGHEEEDPHRYGYVNSKGEAKGFYGKSQNALAILDTAVTEPGSSSWRGNNLFLRQKDYMTEVLPGDTSGERFTIGEYLALEHLRVEKEVRDGLEREGKKLSDFDWETLKGNESKPYKEEIKKRFNRAIKASIARQRLFLGTLMRQSDLDDENKGVIWQKVAEFLPSRMASFLPEETLKIVEGIYGTSKGKETVKKWRDIREKIWIIERARIKDDAKKMKDGEQPTKTLRDFYQGKLSPQEIQLIEALQDMGHKKVAAGEFIKTEFPFTAFLEDAPETSWEELEDDDFDRQLIGDHNNFQEGWSHVITLLANPGVKPADVIKGFNEAYDKISQPPGKRTAQKKLHPFINAYLFMSRRTTAAKYVGALLELARIPRSEMEKYNLQSKIAFDEIQTAEILDGLAQHETISDAPNEADKDGQTQYMMMKEDNDADRKAVFIAYMRLIMMILLPILGKEFFKMILPGDMAKNLGL